MKSKKSEPAIEAIRHVFTGFVEHLGVLHLPTSDPEMCIALRIEVMKTKKHHFDRRGKPKGFAYSDADGIWFRILRMLPEKMWEELLIPLAVAMDASDKRKLDDTTKALKLRKALKGKMTPVEQALAELGAVLNPKSDFDDEPTVIGTDPKIKFARLREKGRQAKELSRYIGILDKHGDESEEARKFIVEVLKRGDGDVLSLCNAVRSARFITMKVREGRKTGKKPKKPSK